MKRIIVENIEGSCDHRRDEGILHPSSLSRTVVCHVAFDPMKPGSEDEIIITHFLPFFVICSNSYSRILERR